MTVLSISTLSYAVKEWAVAVKALEAGKMILLLRKGGIRELEHRFRVEHQQVLLYPTYEHQKSHLLKANYSEQIIPVTSGWHPKKVTVSSWAEITDVFSVDDELIVQQLLDYHIWNEQFVTERFHWKPRQPLYLLLLRVYKLPQSLLINYSQEYGGCKSWINLSEPISLQGSIPVIDESDYKNQVAVIHKIMNYEL